MLLSPLLIVIVLFVGMLIGSVGIGGVLLVPSLKYLGGIDLHSAIPACMLSYIATGTIGAMVYARHGTINWSMAAWVCLGALPGALLGALLLPYLRAGFLETVIALLAIGSGLQSLRKSQNSDIDVNLSGPLRLGFIGLIAGLGSSLSGTGGPLMLIPILIWVKVPVLTAIGLSQVIQIPISTTASLANLIVGNLDWWLGINLAVVMIIGSFLGARLVHIVPVFFLKRLVAIVLIMVGIAMLIKLSGIF